MKLKGKIAIVTASTKGIGLSSALALAKEGARVYLAARNKQLVDEIILNNKELDLKYVNFDATNDESLKKMIYDVVSIENKIDILVNNFGGNNPSKDKTIIDTEANDFLETIKLNLMSVFVPSQEASRVMMKNGGGSIINISTIGSINPDISRIGYVTSKAAINSLTQNIAVQLGKYKIRCNAILPGLINTNAVKNNLSDEFVDVFTSCTPLQRVGEPEDISNAVVFLASDDSSYITGQLLEVAGGFGNSTPIIGMFNKK